MDQQGKEYRFTVIVEPCEEGGFFAHCPVLPGCHVEGETYEEAITEIRHSIAAFIRDYLEDGEIIPDDDVTIASLKIAV